MRSSTSLKGERLLEKPNELYCLSNKKRARREKESREETEKEERRGAKIMRGTGGDTSGHEVSLVATAKTREYARDYRFQHCLEVKNGHGG